MNKQQKNKAQNIKAFIVFICLGFLLYLLIKKLRTNTNTVSPAVQDILSLSANVDYPVNFESTVQPVVVQDYDLMNALTGIFSPIMEMLNQVDLSFIPDFDVPLHPITGEAVFSNLYAGPNYREQVNNPLKKGFTMLEAGVMLEGIEKQTQNKSLNFVSTIPPQKRCIAYSPQTSMNLHSNATVSDILNTDYSVYDYISNEMAGNIATFFDGSATKAKIALVSLDVENQLLNLPTNDLVNRLVAIYDQFHRGCETYTKVSLLYQALPILNVGFGVNRTHYTAQPDAYWTNTTSWTQNAIDKHFPANLIGKSLHTLDYIECIFEYYLFREASLPEGTILKNVLGTNLKNYAGNDISVLTHFGTQTPSFFHYAAHTVAGIQVNKKHLNGKSLRLQTNNFNIAGVGYWYAGNISENQPNDTKLLQSNDGLGRYYVPNKIVQAIELLTFFSGAKYYNWEATFKLHPIARQAGKYVARNENESSRKDYSCIAAQQAVMKELCTKKVVGNNSYSVADLIDGSEIYTDEHTQVDYLSVPNFSVMKEINPLDWKEFKLSPVLSIVNETKRLVAILHFQAYDSEQTEIDYYYTKNGFNFKQRLQNPQGQINISIFSL